MKKSAKIRWAITALAIYTFYAVTPAPFWEGLMQGIIQHSQHAVPGAALAIIWGTLAFLALRSWVRSLKRKLRDIQSRCARSIQDCYQQYGTEVQAQAAYNAGKGRNRYGTGKNRQH